MTREDIIKLAKKSKWGASGSKWLVTDAGAERFAALVAEAEREACAKICDGEATLYYSAERCATKIRARGSK
jgi:hypothetical protein